MACKFTVKIPSLPTDVKGISPDDEKTLTKDELRARQIKMDDYNEKAYTTIKNIRKELSLHVDDVDDVDVQSFSDGTFQIICPKSVVDVEKVIKDFGLEIMPSTQIPTTKYLVDVAGVKSFEEDVDEVLEQKPLSEKNTLIAKPVVNQYAIKSGLV